MKKNLVALFLLATVAACPSGALTAAKPNFVLGCLSVPDAGVHELSLRPVPTGWQPLILLSLTLRPTTPPKP
jgi:hypothetical protein